MTVLCLSETDVEQLLDMATTLAVIEEAFRQLAAGNAHNTPRSRDTASGLILHSMNASAAYLGVAGWKHYTTSKAGAKFIVGLHAEPAGDLCAFIQADRLGQMRTGAATGVAVKYLSAPEADEVGLLGSGWQAESQLQAIAAVRALRKVVVYSRNADSRARFASQMTEQLGIEVIPAPEARDAVAGKPIVVTATTSKTPVLDGSWLEPQTLVCAVGSNWLSKAELDVTTVQRASRIVCDSIECCQREAGDFVAALNQGVFDWSRAADLASLVSRREMPGNNSSGITLFKSVGMAIEDIATAAKLVELARARGAGREVEIFS